VLSAIKGSRVGPGGRVGQEREREQASRDDNKRNGRPCQNEIENCILYPDLDTPAAWLTNMILIARDDVACRVASCSSVGSLHLASCRVHLARCSSRTLGGSLKGLAGVGNCWEHSGNWSGHVCPCVDTMPVCGGILGGEQADGGVEGAWKAQVLGRDRATALLSVCPRGRN
jgi:hypothetical protein